MAKCQPDREKASLGATGPGEAPAKARAGARLKAVSSRKYFEIQGHVGTKKKFYYLLRKIEVHFRIFGHKELQLSYSSEAQYCLSKANDKTKSFGRNFF